MTHPSTVADTLDVGHTPGPWHLCQHLKSIEADRACRCGYRGVVYGPDHDAAMAICQPGHELPRDEEQWGSEPGRYPRAVELANMRLIAAAPDLLDALVKIEADPANVALYLDCGGRHAIDKARGEVQP